MSQIRHVILRIKSGKPSGHPIDHSFCKCVTVLIILMPEAEAVEEAGNIMITLGTRVPMSALLLLRAMLPNRIRIHLTARAVNVVVVTVVALAVGPMEANRAADS